MDEKTIIQIMGLVIGGIATGILGLIFWGIRKLITTVFENTVAIISLEKSVHKLDEAVKPIPKLQKDINEFHSWKREVQGENT